MSTDAAEVDLVLEVPPDEQEAYVQTSYRDYLRIWRRLRRGVKLARTNGDIESEARLSHELRHLWPRPEVIAKQVDVIDFDLDVGLPSVLGDRSAERTAEGEALA